MLQGRKQTNKYLSMYTLLECFTIVHTSNKDFWLGSK